MLLTEHSISTELETIAYLTECNLATVGHMYFLKNKSKSEFLRQIHIAQIGINMLKSFNFDGSRYRGITRVVDILKSNKTVEEILNEKGTL